MQYRIQRFQGLQCLQHISTAQTVQKMVQKYVIKQHQNKVIQFFNTTICCAYKSLSSMLVAVTVD